MVLHSVLLVLVYWVVEVLVLVLGIGIVVRYAWVTPLFSKDTTPSHLFHAD